MQKPLTRVDAPVNLRGSAVLGFGKHPTGDYAVVVIYDLNNDGELDTGLFGIPTEKVGFSNDARGRFGPPKWEDSRFDASDDVETEIQLTARIRGLWSQWEEFVEFHTFTPALKPIK